MVWPVLKLPWPGNNTQSIVEGVKAIKEKSADYSYSESASAVGDKFNLLYQFIVPFQKKNEENQTTNSNLFYCQFQLRTNHING